MKLLRVAVLALIAALATSSMTPANADVRTSVSVSFFYDSLAPHGQWISSAQFGYVWRPVHVYAGWRPYYDGEWIYTDYGWTFASDDPWGWATYHYGRWYLDPYYGWIWVPGYEWAPAWVVFHQGSGYIGWAPLPPNISLSLVIGGGYRIDPRAYCFVEERHFVDRRVNRHVVSRERNVTLVRSTTNVTHYSRTGDRYYNRSLSTDRIERAARRRIERHRIVDVSDNGRTRMRVDGDRVAIFRPQVSRRATHAPAKVVRHVESRGDARVDRDRDTRRESSARVERDRDTRREPPARIERTISKPKVSKSTVSKPTVSKSTVSKPTPRERVTVEQSRREPARPTLERRDVREERGVRPERAVERPIGVRGVAPRPRTDDRVGPRSQREERESVKKSSDRAQRSKSRKPATKPTAKREKEELKPPHR